MNLSTKGVLRKIKKITTPDELILDDDQILLEDEKADLLAEGCKLNKQKKAAEKKLKQIKKLLDLSKGEYVNKNGDKLVITEVDKFTEIDPEKLYKKFLKNKKTKQFFSSVKVQIGELKKHIPESAIEKMREELDPTQKWTYK